MTTEIPTLPAERTGDGVTIRLWCRYCDSPHLHGDPGEEGTLHRWAHCFTDNSPYTESGYMLDVVPKGTQLQPPRSERRKPRYVDRLCLHRWGSE